MDLEGRQKIARALATIEGYHTGEIVNPDEYEFKGYEGEDRSMARLERVHYVDVLTYLSPWQVRQALRGAGLLVVEGQDPKGAGEPRLRLDAMAVTPGGMKVLSFEDMAEADS